MTDDTDPIDRAVAIARRTHDELEPLIAQLARQRSPRACVIIGLVIGVAALCGEVVTRNERVKTRRRRGAYRRNDRG